MRIPIRSLATLLLAVGVATCADAPVAALKQGGNGPVSGRGMGHVSLVPVFSKAAQYVATHMADFGLTFDHVRVVIVRPVADTVADTTIVFSPGAGDVHLDLSVQVLTRGETFTGDIDYKNGDAVVFHGEGTVQSYLPGDPVPPPGPITLHYEGQGAAVTHITISPKTPSVVTPNTATLTVTAFDANNNTLTTPVAWTSSDVTVATISPSGATATLTPTGKRGVVTITALTPSAATDNAVATITLPAASIALVSGGGQTGKAGAGLAQPGVVRVLATDGIGVAGVTVNFAAPVGGKVGAASVVTDATGQASTALTLGGTAGPQSFSAIAAGFSVAIPATATAGDPAAIAVVSGSGQSDTVKHALKLPFVAKVTDAFGNAIAGVTVTWARTAGAGTLSAASSVTAADGTTSVGYTLGAVVGTETITATAAGIGVSATFTAQALSSGPSAIAVVSGNAQSARVTQALPAALVVLVTDNASNPVANATITWTAANGTLGSPTTTTDATGQSSNTLTLGTVAGAASATATVGGKSVTFTATAQPGVVAQAQFKVGPPAGAPGVVLAPAIQVALLDAQGNATAAVNAVTLALGANPGGAVLGGTLTQNAVAGVATFNDLTVSKAGVGYTLVASSANVANVTSAAFNIGGVVVPNTMFIFGGDGQTAQVNTAVEVPPAVKVADAGEKPVQGVAVTFTPAPGNGVAAPVVVNTNAAGVAALTSWTLGAVVGAQSLVASSPGIAPVTFHATGTAVPGGKTWTGAVSNDWSVAGNWNGGVPVGGDNVVIPAGTPHQPVLVGVIAVNINDLTLAAGASLEIGNSGIAVFGNLDASGPITDTGNGFLQMGGVGKTLKGTVANLTFGGAQLGSATIVGPTTITGAVSIAQLFTLTIGAFTVTTGAMNIPGGTLAIGAGAIVTSTSLFVSNNIGGLNQTGGVYTVTGPALFAGGSSVGLLTGGTLAVGGNFTQTNVQQIGSPLSFVAAGTHKVILNGAGAQLVHFDNPGQSRFQDFEIDGPGNVSFNSAVVAAGQLITPGPGTPTVLGGGNTLIVAGLNVGGLVLDNTLLTSAGGVITKFDNVTFQNYAPAATPFTLTHPGAAAGFVFNNTKFLVAPTTGSYMNVTDTAPQDGNVLTITLVGSVPADGSAQTATAGGALVHWGGGGVQDAWSNAAGGLWSVPANWSLGRVPIATDAVVIALGGTYTVTLDVDFTGTAVTLGGQGGNQTLVIGGGRVLTLSNVLTVLPAGILTFGNGRVLGTGSVTNQGRINLTSGTITTSVANQNGGVIIVNGISAITGALTTAAGSAIHLLADATTDFVQLTVNNGFTNLGTLDLSSVGGAWQAFLSVTNGTLINQGQGTITTLPGTGGPRTIDAELNNQNTVTINALTTLSHQGAVNVNSGTLLVAGADLTLNQIGVGSSFTNTGTINMAAGRTWAITGGTFNQNAGPLGGFGKLSLNNVVANFTTDFGNGNTFLDMNNATFNGPGSLTNVPRATLTLLSSTIGATATLNNQGILIVNASSNINGPLTTAAGSIIRLQPDATTDFAALTVANAFTNLGGIELTSVGGAWESILQVTNGTLTNAPTGTITSLVGTGGQRIFTAQLDNQGTFTVNQPLTINSFNSAHKNSGTLDMTAGDLTLQQFGATPTFANTGTVTIGGGHIWTVTGGTLNLNGGAIGGAGTLSMIGLTANLAADVTNAVTALTVNATTINGPGKLTNATGQTFTLLSSIIGPTSGLTNQGTLVVNGNSVINGPVVTVAGSILRVQPDATTDFAQLTVANGFANLGAIELTSVGGAWQTVLNVTNGTLTNGATGTISSLPGTGGPRFLNAQLDNQNTITVTAPLQMTTNNAAHKNSGTIDLTAGDLTLTQFGAPGSFTNTGTVTIGAGHVWSISQGTLNLNGGAVGGQGTLSLTTVTANLAADINNAVTALTVNNSIVNGPGKFTNVSGQTFTLLNSTIGANSGLTNQGLLIANGTSFINGPLVTVAGSTVRILPDATTDFSQLIVANGFANLGAIELTSVGGAWQSILAVTAGTLTNSPGGTITSLVGTGGARFLRAQLDNQNVLTVSQPLTMDVNNVQHKNSGTVDLTAADLTMSLQGGGSFTNTGTVTIGPAHLWSITGGTLNLNGGAVGGQGTLSLLTVTANLAADITNAVTALTVNNSTINGPGKFTNVTGQTFTLLSSTIGANSGLTNQGTLIVNGNSAINGPLVTAAGSTLRVRPDQTTDFGQLTVLNGFQNNGAIELTSVGGAWQSLLTVTNGTLTNMPGTPGGTITSLPGTGGARFLRAQVDNQNVITVSTPLTMDDNGVAHKNSGTVDLTAADLTMSLFGAGSFTNTGTVTIGAGHLWSVSGGTLNENQGGAIGGAGTLALSQVTANFFANFDNSVTALTVGAVTTINGPGKFTNATGKTFTLLNSTIGATSGLTNQGTLIVNSFGTINGPLVTVAGSTIRVQPDATTDFASLTIANGFLNNGAIELTSVGGAWQSILTVSAGNLTNTAQGTISSLAGTGGARQITAPIINQGTLTVAPLAAQLLTITGAFNTSGTVNLELGGLVAGTQYDQIVINGAATLGGTLNVTLLGQYVPVLGDQYNILTFTSVVGDFGTVNLPGGGSNWFWGQNRAGTVYTLTRANNSH